MKSEQWERDRRVVQLASGSVSCVVTGKGEAALFVHGMMLNSAVWRRLVGELNKERRCVVPDLLGHGNTAATPTQPLGLAHQASMLADLCATMGLSRVDVIANDVGGAVAQIFAVAYPELMRTLTLTNCDVHYNLGPPQDMRRIAALARAGVLGDAIARMLSDTEFARVQFPGKGFENPQNLTAADVVELIGPGVRSESGRKSLEQFVLSLQGDELVRIEARLRQLATPTLLVWGTEDPYFGLSWAYWLRDAIPNVVALHEIPGASLFAIIERPEEVAEPIRQFWRQHV